MNGRALLSAAILGGWGVGLAMLAQRELSESPRDVLAEAAVRVSPGADYFLVDETGAHIGFASTTIDTIPDGLQISEYEVVNADDGVSNRAVEQIVIVTSRALLLRQVQRTVTKGGLTRTQTATVEGDSVLRVVVRDSASADTTWRSFEAPLLLPSLVPLAVALGERPEPGDSRTFSVYDPGRDVIQRRTYGVRAESVLVVLDSAVYDGVSKRWRGVHVDSVRVWHLWSPDAPLDLWIDERGSTVLRARDGRTLRRAAYELAFENWRSATAGAASATPVDARPGGAGLGLDDPVMVDYMRVAVDGLDLARLAVRTATQRDSGNVITVRRVHLTNASPDFWLPLHRLHRARFAQHLKVEPMIDVEDPAVVALGKRLRGRENDPRVVARIIATWVRDSLSLQPDMPVASAGATLRSRAGSAEGHANLFVALARASDVPSRVVAGAVMQDGRPVHHIWAEVLVGDWIPVDPTAGQFPADARRLRLVIGAGVGDELSRLIQRAKWRSLAVLRAPQDQRPTARAARRDSTS
jgi:hypothetical protein